MIQEKDFLYRVPVKTAPITTPRGQIRNPEILVDLEGGEFMHGNILDANSTNKLINQSVKDAVDDKFIESGYVTKDLLEAETSARTKGDEDLDAKIQAEQTRAEGKEKEISDKLAIVDGDSNTEGSFRKAIADVIAAAPEDLDTLKEIADKLAGNDDLHTALNQAITEKADASALANEVARATGAESGLQAAIATKADATALEGAKTEFDEKLNNLKFVPYNSIWTDSYSVQHYKLPDRKGIDLSAYTVSTKLFGDAIKIANESESLSLYRDSMSIESSGRFNINVNSTSRMTLLQHGSYISAKINDTPVIEIKDATGIGNSILKLNAYGITLPNGDDNHVLTSNAGTIDITQYALKSQLDTKVDTAIIDVLTGQISQIEINVAGKQDKGNYIEYSSKNNDGYTIDCEFNTSEPITVDDGTGYLTYITQSGIGTHDSSGRKSNLTATSLSIDSSPTTRTTYTVNGITTTQYKDCLATSDGTFKPISDFVLKEDANEEYVKPEDFENLKQAFSGLSRKVSSKQDIITANIVDVINLETADIIQLRAIVKDLLNALNSSGLIIESSGLE